MMITIHAYMRDTILLTRSIMFKFEHVNTYMNRNIERDYGITTPHNKEDSKYYLNLYGLPHSTDSDIEVYIPDIKEVGIITKYNIINYPILQNNLLNKSQVYYDLLNTYTKENLLIKGMLNPISSNETINALDGDILYYDKQYVNANEDNLIYEISKYIKSYLDTYYNRKYNIDDYHIPGIISNIYTTLPIQILRIRMANIFTNRVDNFHLYTFLNSYKGLTVEDLSFISTSSTIWLYGNLRQLDNNIGSNLTLNTIFDKIYDSSNIGIGNITINNTLPTITNDIFNKNQTIYTKDKHMTLVRSNKSSKVTDKTYTLKDVLSLELSLDKLNKDDYETIYDNNKTIINKIDKETKSKVFIFDEMDIRIMYNTTVTNLIFNNLIYYVTADDFNVEYDFLNPSDNTYHKLDKHSVKYILIATLFIQRGIDINKVTIDDYKIEGMLNRNILVKDVLKNTILKDKLKPIVNDILGLIRSSIEPYDESSFSDRINLIRKIYAKIWYYITNTNDIIISSDLKTVFNNILKTMTVTEDNTKTINELLINSVGKDFYIAPNLAGTTLSKLCKDVFNLDADEYSNISDTYDKYINFIEKFKSYTVQFLYDTTYMKTLFTYNTSITIGNQQRTVGNVYGAYYKKNNNINIVLSSVYKLHREQLSVFDTLTPDSVINTGNTSLMVIDNNITDINSMVNITTNIGLDRMVTDDVYNNVPIDINNASVNEMLNININTINPSRIYAIEESMLSDLEMYAEYGSYDIMKTMYGYSVTLVDNNTIYKSILEEINIITNTINTTVISVNNIISNNILQVSELTTVSKLQTNITSDMSIKDIEDIYNNIVINVGINNINDIPLLTSDIVDIYDAFNVVGNHTGYTLLKTMYGGTDVVIDTNIIYKSILEEINIITNTINTTVISVNDVISNNSTHVAELTTVNKLQTSDTHNINISDIENIYNNINQEILLSTISTGNNIIDTIEDDVLLSIDTGMLIDTN